MSLFAHLFLSFATAVSVFIHPNATPTQKVQQTPSPQVQMIDATGDIEKNGITMHLEAQFPQNGGKITGTVSGDCTGTIGGTYSGATHGKILDGTVHADCSVYVITVSGNATFHGIVNNDETYATVDYTAAARNTTQNGTFTFALTRE